MDALTKTKFSVKFEVEAIVEIIHEDLLDYAKAQGYDPDVLEQVASEYISDFGHPTVYHLDYSGKKQCVSMGSDFHGVLSYDVLEGENGLEAKLIKDN